MRHLRNILLVLFLMGPTASQAQDVAAPAVVTADAETTVAVPAAPAVPEVSAPAAAEPEEAPKEGLSTEEVVGVGVWVIKAIKGGDWGLAIAGILMILVWVMRRFLLKNIPGAYMPWVAAGMGAATAVAAALQAGSDWMAVVSAGLMAGLAASGLWSLGGKKLMPKEKTGGEAPAEAGG